MKPCFFATDSDTFKQQLKDKNQADFRIDQITDWVWRKGVTDPEKMGNLPKELRESFTVHSMVCDLHLKSEDGTIKRRLKLNDSEYIESVSIPMGDKWTLCVSSQTGCAMGCQFCATGLKRKFRNLTGKEIAEQLLWHWQDVGDKPSRIVFMGMGEPLSNRKGLSDSIDIISSEIGLSGRRMTVSTVGMLDGIKWLSQRKPPVNLALSLHSAIDETRSRLVPTAKASVQELVEACRQYRNETGRDVTYELVLLKGINDDALHAEVLADIVEEGVHVNLIPYNPGGAGEFARPSRKSLDDFSRILKQSHVSHTLRMPRGQDINAACGELIIQ